MSISNVSNFSYLAALGLSPDRMMMSLGVRYSSTTTLNSLQDDFQSSAGDIGMQMFQGGFLPPALLLPPPIPGGDADGWAASLDQDFGDFGDSTNPLERFLQMDPFARQMLEMMLGGRIQPGMADNIMQVEPFSSGFGNAGLSTPGGNIAADLLNKMGLLPGANNSPYQGLMLNGLHNLIKRAQEEEAKKAEQGPYASQFGLGAGDDMSALNDPGLTVEDKVTLMIMMIMKKMDKDIEKQAQHVQKLQAQQKEGGAEAGKEGEGGSKSIDVETMKMKRLIDKRSQMFDMLRQIIDKYNQTAKGIIDSINR